MKPLTTHDIETLERADLIAHLRVLEAHIENLESHSMIQQPLNRLRDAAYATSARKGFHEPGNTTTVGDRLCLMHSELSEALEYHRKGNAPDAMWYETPRGYRVNNASGPDDKNEAPSDGSSIPFVLFKPCGIPSELADVVIRIFDFCGHEQIDLDRAVREKMAFNETRPHKHGKVL